jgi:hypothetical protein
MGKFSGTVWLIIIGILIGPAYFFYCEMFSGRVVAKGSGALLQADLDPSMNPVSILAHGYSDRRVQTFQAVLRLGRSEVWRKGFSISAHDRDGTRSSNTVGLGTLRISSPGAYELMVYGSSSIQVEIRRNVRDPNMAVVWAGVVMLVLGLLIRLSSRPGSAER